MLILLASTTAAETLRIATYNAALSRKGPGLLLRDILKEETQVMAAAAVIARSSPDILLLIKFDYDHGQAAATAFGDLMARDGLRYPYIYARRPNNGWPTGVDIDGDGRLGEAEDAQGYGAFSGQSGMVVFSKYPIDAGQMRDFSQMLWRDFPKSKIPLGTRPGEVTPEAAQLLRLSSVGHWLVPIDLPNGRLHLMAFHANTPVFDGPEDRNGWRNHDEIMLWRHILDGRFGPAPDHRFVLLGTFNLDPQDGEGRRQAIHRILADRRLQDPKPNSAGGQLAGLNGQIGDPALDTADWEEPKPGNLRVDYVLPSADLKVINAGVDWPAPDDAGLQLIETASVHRLVWVDVALGGS